MRKVEARMICAVLDLIAKPDHEGKYLNCGNTTVTQHHHGIANTVGYERIISIRLHGNEIAAIRPAEGTVWISDCGWRTTTTKARLNTIISCLTKHNGITQRKGQWVQLVGDGAYEWKGHDVFPLNPNENSYHMMQASKLIEKSIH